jgi:riboflavin kinase/FMN adenylyltransferase
MQQFASLQEARAHKVWLAIGAFDGLHLGHQRILKDLTAAAHAARAPAVVLTFYPHPIEVLRGPRNSFYLMSLEEKVEHLNRFNVDVLITHPFDQTTVNTSARDFVALLKKQLDLQQLWVGHDFALGHNREGNFATLQKFGQKLDFSVHLVKPVTLDGEVISSSRIRALLAEGDIAQAARMLGRPYSLFGEVVGGAKRGRSIGIPTANIKIWEKRAVPASGVYVTRASLGGQRWGAVTNIGVRPTFEDKLTVPIVETHILDYEGDEFYGQTLNIEFISRLRAERRFAGVDELVNHIHKDIQAARDVFKQ